MSLSSSGIVNTEVGSAWRKSNDSCFGVQAKVTSPDGFSKRPLAYQKYQRRCLMVIIDTDEECFENALVPVVPWCPVTEKSARCIPGRPGVLPVRDALQGHLIHGRRVVDHVGVPNGCIH